MSKVKYNENIILHKIKEFIEKSYKGHYTTTEEGFQAMDIFRQLEIDKNFCQANAIKYLLRYGKKNGRNEHRLSSFDETPLRKSLITGGHRENRISLGPIKNSESSFGI